MACIQLEHMIDHLSAEIMIFHLRLLHLFLSHMHLLYKRYVTAKISQHLHILAMQPFREVYGGISYQSLHFLHIGKSLDAITSSTTALLFSN